MRFCMVVLILLGFAGFSAGCGKEIQTSNQNDTPTVTDIPITQEEEKGTTDKTANITQMLTPSVSDSGDQSNGLTETEKTTEDELSKFREDSISTDYYKDIELFIPGLDLNDYQCIYLTDRSVVWIPTADDPKNYMDEVKKIEPALEKAEEYLGVSLEDCTSSKEKRVHFFYGSTQFAFTPCYNYDKPVVFAPNSRNQYCYHCYMHEMVHILTASIYPGELWAFEGIAVYLNDFLGGGENFPNYGDDLDRLTHNVIDKADIMDKIGDDNFYITNSVLTTDVGSGFYTASGALVKYLIQDIGINEFMEMYNSGDITQAIKDNTGKDFSELKAEWMGYLRKQ